MSERLSQLEPLPSQAPLPWLSHQVASHKGKLYTALIIPQLTYLWLRCRYRKALRYYLVETGALLIATLHNSHNSPTLAKASLEALGKRVKVLNGGKLDSRVLAETLSEDRKRKINALLRSAYYEGAFEDPLETGDAIVTELAAYVANGQLDSAQTLVQSKKKPFKTLLESLNTCLEKIGTEDSIKINRDVVRQNLDLAYFAGLTLVVWTVLLAHRHIRHRLPLRWRPAPPPNRCPHA